MTKLYYCEKHKIWTHNCVACYYNKVKKSTPYETTCSMCQKDFDSMKNNCSYCGNKLR